MSESLSECGRRGALEGWKKKERRDGVIGDAGGKEEENRLSIA